MFYLAKDIMQRKPTGNSLSTLSPNIDEWKPITQRDSTTCWLPSPWAIMVGLHLVHLNAIDKLSNNDLLLDNVPGAPPPEDTPNKDPIDPYKPDLTCTPDPTKTKAHKQVVGVENTRGKVYGKATGLDNTYRKYAERWNPWHPFQSAHNIHQVQSFRQQTKTWIDQHLRCGLHY